MEQITPSPTNSRRTFWVIFVTASILSLAFLYCCRRLDNPFPKFFQRCSKCLWRHQSPGEMCCKNYLKSWWPYIHFAMFFAFGVLVPGFTIDVMIGSFFYEVVEGMVSTFTTGCWQDVAVNTVAYFLGTLVRSSIN